MTDETPVSAAPQAVETVSAPIAVEAAPVVESAPITPVVEAVIAEPVVVAAEPSVTQVDILSPESAKEPVVEAEKAPTETKEEAPQSEEPAPLPTYDAWVVPEGITLDQERIGKFNEVLGEFQNKTKADSDATKAFGQKLVDYHLEQVNSALQASQKSAIEYIANKKAEWAGQFEKEFGNSKDTVIKGAMQHIRNHGGTQEEVSNFLNELSQTGLSNNPTLIKLLAKSNIAMSEGHPIAAVKPENTAPKSQIQKRYGG